MTLERQQGFLSHSSSADQLRHTLFIFLIAREPHLRPEPHRRHNVRLDGTKFNAHVRVGVAHCLIELESCQFHILLHFLNALRS
jgi:hypothetical protein